MDGVITAAAVLLAVVGGLLVGDVLRVWRLDRASVAGPERAQVLTGVTILVFATAFLLAHGGGEQTQAAPAAKAVPDSENSALTRLATPARPPALQAPDEDRPNRDRNRRPHGNAEAPAEPAPAEPPTTTTTTSVPTTTTPAPTTTTTTTPPPAPEPTAPSQGPVPFDSRE